MTMSKKMPQTFVTKSWTSTKIMNGQFNKLNINNIESIDSINTKVKFHLWNSMVIYCLIIFGLIIFLYLKYKKRNIITVINNVKPVEKIPIASATIQSTK